MCYTTENRKLHIVKFQLWPAGQSFLKCAPADPDPPPEIPFKRGEASPEKTDQSLTGVIKSDQCQTVPFYTLRLCYSGYAY